MPLIQFGGVASGIDTGSIVSQLVALRREPIRRLETQKGDLQRRLASLDDLKSKLDQLAEAARKIDTPGEFSGRAANVANESLLTATASGEAPAGIYQIQVDALAQTHRELSQSYTDTSVSVGTGTFSFTLGGVQTDVTLSAGQDSLADLKAAINAADAGVTASVVNDGTGYRLMLSADDPGAANQFTVDASGLSGGTAPTFTTSSTGQDAQITIDTGLVITSTSNTINGAIEGLTLELRATGSTELNIEADSEELAGNLQAFVDAFNGVVDLLDAQTAEGGALEGSSLARTVKSRLSSTMTSVVDDTATYRLAADVGLSLDRDGKLSLDRSKLDTALANDYQAVVDLFTANGTSTGVAVAVAQLSDDITDFTGGLIATRKDGIDDQIRRIDDDIENKNRSLELYETMLNRKFTAMELAISRLQQQSGFLG